MAKIVQILFKNNTLLGLDDEGNIWTRRLAPYPCRWVMHLPNDRRVPEPQIDHFIPHERTNNV